MMTEKIPLVGERTRNIPWLTGRMRPVLRRSPALRPLADADEPTVEIVLRPPAPVAVVDPPRPARPGRGRHRAPFTPLLTRVRRALRPKENAQ